MNNLTAVRSLCNAIASTFYPDDHTIVFALYNEQMAADAEAVPKDARIFRVALSLIMGYIERSRSEGGVSVSVADEKAIRNSINFWCGRYGLDAEDELTDYIRTIENGSNLW